MDLSLEQKILSIKALLFSHTPTQIQHQSTTPISKNVALSSLLA